MRALITTELLRKLPSIPPGKQSLDIRDEKLRGFVVRVRPSGQHSYLVSLGRGRWYTIGAVTALKPDKAREHARGMLADRDRGKDPIAERRAERRAGLTLETFLSDHYEPWATTHRKSGENTAARIRSRFAEFVSRPIGELTAFQIEKWRTARLKAGRTHATVNRDVVALKAALNRGVAWKVIAANPLQDVKPFTEDKIGRLRFLSEAEEQRLRKALDNRDTKRKAERERANAWRRERRYAEWPAYGTYTDNLTPIVVLALNTGLRFGELTALEWRDVDLTAAMLTVRSESAKSGKARHVPLNAEAVKVLKAWQPQDYSASAYVFPGRDGGRLGDIKTAWAPLLKAAKITGFRFHDLRHTFASKLVMRGVDLNTLRELLGHADLKMTLRYAHLAPEHTAAAVAKLV